MTEFEKALKAYSEAHQEFVKYANEEVRVQKKVVASRKNLLLAKEALREAERNSLNY